MESNRPDRHPDSSRKERAGWSWKVEETAQNPGLGLLYEPGNWGDVLKGTWAVEITRELVRSRPPSSGPLRVLDPFAGAPTYPLTDSAARRLEWLGASTFVESQRSWIESGELASTGLLVRTTALACGRPIRVDVFDTAADRLETWAAIPEARRLTVASGEAALRTDDVDLILVDPYDLFDRWPEILPLACAAARKARVLLYLYNRAPRGGGHWRNYGALRRRLDDCGCGAALLGRLPSDLLVPRGFHEVVLLGPSAPSEELQETLRSSCEYLATRLATAGSFERLPSRASHHAPERE